MKKRNIQDEYFVRSKVKQGPRLCCVILQVVHFKTNTVLLEINRLTNNKNQALYYKIALEKLLFEEKRIYNVMLWYAAKEFNVDVEGKTPKEVWKILKPKLKKFNEKARRELENVD